MSENNIPGIDDGTSATAVSTTQVAAEAPLDPATYAELVEIGTRYPQARSGLLPMLHLIQSVEGQVTSRGIEACAEILGISAAEVSGVATFYTMYKRRPVGDYHVGVCTNTLCAVMGGDLIFERLKDHLDIGNDETTDDGKVTLEHIECNAACDYAPMMTVNWEFMDNMTPESAVQLVDDLRSGVEVHSTRGPRLCTWREAERVLAGFPDDLADEGPSAGPASLVGLNIARERGWTAPTPQQASESSQRGRRRRGRHHRRQGRGQPRGRAQGVRGDASRSPAPTPSTRTTPRTREGTRSDRHAHASPHGQLGCRPLVDAEGVRGAGRLRRAQEGARDAAGRGHRGGQGLQPPWPRRRRLPHRHEVGLHPAGQPEPEVPRGQRRRVGAGHLQGHPADDGQPAHAGRGRHHQLLRDPRQHTRSSTCAARCSTSYAGSSAPCRRPTSPATSARTSTAPATTSTWSSTPVPAPTSVARRPRCSTRSRVVADNPVCARRSPRSPVSTPAPPSSTTSSRSRRCRASSTAAPSGSPRWAPRSPRATGSSRSRATSPTPASSRRRSASPCAS